MSDVVFDSNIVIDVMAGIPKGVEELERHADIWISVITWIEVMSGAPAGLEARFRDTLAGYRRIELTPEVAERAAIIRRDRRIKLPDAIIQASAEVRGLTLVTRNEKDFPEGTPGVRVPYRI